MIYPAKVSQIYICIGNQHVTLYEDWWVGEGTEKYLTAKISCFCTFLYIYC